MEAAAQQTFTFRGATPSDGEHEVRQMRSIWPGGGCTAVEEGQKYASEMEAAAQQTFTFRGATPSDGENIMES